MSDAFVKICGRSALFVFLCAFAAVFCVSATAFSSENATFFQPGALNVTGTFELKEIDPDLSGRSVTIAAVCPSMTYIDGKGQGDYAINIEHECFDDADIEFVDGIDLTKGISEHATAIGAILLGSDPNGWHPEVGNFRYEGIAPDAQLDVYEFWRFVSRYVYGGEELRADVLTMSIGVVFEDWWTRGIEHLADSQGVIVVAGIGNGSSVFDPPLYPGAGSNVIGVGVVDSIDSEDLAVRLSAFGLASPEHSSCGPTSDQRAKPDIVAPGNCLVPGADSQDGYEVSGDWSSFATPVVAGTVGLLVEKAKSDPLLGGAYYEAGANCVIKAIVLNSATKLPYWHKGKLSKDDDHTSPLDHAQGAGMLNAVGAYATLVAGEGKPGSKSALGWDNNTIARTAEAERSYVIEVSDPKKEVITATLVWNRHYADKYPFEADYSRDSDLRLELWAIDHGDRNIATLIDHSDSVNDNVEHIYFHIDPNYSLYEIVVAFSPDSIDEGEQGEHVERYGLAWEVGEGQSKENSLWYDLNSDGEIDEEDFAVMLSNIDKADADDQYLLGDLNDDGVIDLKDLIDLSEHMKL